MEDERIIQLFWERKEDAIEELNQKYGESVSDLARLFQISNHNVTVRLSRIREKLKIHLKKEGIWL